MEEESEEKNKSLFPLFASSQLPPKPQSWLQNPSFTADISTLQPPPALPASASDDDEEPRPQRRTYDLVISPSSSASEKERRRRTRRRKEKKRRGKRTREGSVNEDESRRTGVRVWAGSREDAKDDKDYYFDSRGDPDNLAFGSIYRMDVARYRRQSPSELYEVLSWYRWKPQISPLNEDGDINWLDGVLRMGGRYYSARYSNLERHKDFKHVKVAAKKPLMFTEDFIPFMETQSFSEGIDVIGEEHLEESWEDEVILKTREFNKLLRESPQNEAAWIAFAEFQDKIASTQRQKAARLQSLEKKIRILEKAVEVNPESEPLLLSLLKSYERRDSGEVLVRRCEKMLVKHYGSYRLWKEFLLLVQGEFSRFKVSEVRRRYAHAIQALSSCCDRLCRQGYPPGKSEQKEPELVRLELDLVDIFLSLCRFEWQTGFQELATGLLQAQIEYSLFAPSLQLASQSKLRLFEHFWSSGGARVGEEGAVGWSTWIDKEEEYREKVVKEDSELETDSGGWTGWFTPSISEEADKENGKTVEIEKDVENDKEDPEVEGAEQEDDIEALLKKLGVSVDVDHQTEIKDTDTWNRWSTEETQRDCSQWMPVRENSDGDDADQLSRSILFEDVCNFLFPLCSEEARLRLISRFIDFYGGKISQWTCTNDPSWVTDTLTLDTIPGFVSESLHDAFLLLLKVHSCTNDVCMEVLFGGSGNIRRQADMIRFLRNSLVLCLHVFPRNYILEEALLISEELLMSQTNHSSLVTPSQALAKQLLKNDRQNLLLSGLYARREAACGNINRARKVFDMTLSLICDLPLDLRENIPLLYLWYAEMEVDNDNADRSSLRAIHILSCLGGNAQYSPFSEPTSNLLLLRAHNGFRDQLKQLQSAWFRGFITDSSIAIVCSATLFEILTRGCKTGIQVIEEALSMALPDRRCQSQQLESLSVYYIKLLQKHANELKLQVVWGKILQQLQTYPFSPKVLSAVIEVGCLFTVPQKIRFVLDEYSQRKPSVLIMLFALLFELGRPCSEHRIRVLFERALANDQLQKSVILWRCYLAFEFHTAGNISGARRIFFRAIHTCPWSKKLWLDGFQKLSSVLTANELSDLHEVMRDKELNLRTDIYEILLQDEFAA